MRIREYHTVDDCGTIINPMIVEGQVHGGLAQGIGQAMMEHVIYDPWPASHRDIHGYAMPRASDMPPLQSDYICVPAPSNPLGSRAASETGTIGPRQPSATPLLMRSGIWRAQCRAADDALFGLAGDAVSRR